MALKSAPEPLEPVIAEPVPDLTDDAFLRLKCCEIAASIAGNRVGVAVNALLADAREIYEACTGLPWQRP